jgi:hypothetical protein
MTRPLGSARSEVRFMARSSEEVVAAALWDGTSVMPSKYGP